MLTHFHIGRRGQCDSPSLLSSAHESYLLGKTRNFWQALLVSERNAKTVCIYVWYEFAPPTLLVSRSVKTVSAMETRRLGRDIITHIYETGMRRYRQLELNKVPATVPNGPSVVKAETLTCPFGISGISRTAHPEAMTGYSLPVMQEKHSEPSNALRTPAVKRVNSPSRNGTDWTRKADAAFSTGVLFWVASSAPIFVSRNKKHVSNRVISDTSDESGSKNSCPEIKRTYGAIVRNYGGAARA